MADYQGLDADFASRLRALVAASGGRITLVSGFHSVDQQQALWNAPLAKYGSAEAARHWVAPPGHSNHNRGMAMDLGGDLALAHKLAGQFGLTFPLGNEPWHLEPVGARKGASPQAYQTNPTAPAATAPPAPVQPAEPDRHDLGTQLESFHSILAGIDTSGVTL